MLKSFIVVVVKSLLSGLGMLIGLIRLRLIILTVKRVGVLLRLFVKIVGLLNMLRSFSRVIKCRFCGFKNRTRKLNGSWFICGKCGKGNKIRGFECGYNVRCRLCGKGFSPVSRYEVNSRVCPKCKKEEVKK